jgi:hypothetical protein
VPRSVLLEGLGEGADGVLERLVEERTIVVRRTRRTAAEEAELELVHESLVQTWPRLRQWLDEGREDAAFVAEVGQAAELWERRGQRQEELWGGEALDEALRSLHRCKIAVPGLVKRFIEAGRERRQQRQQRRRRTTAVTITTLVCISLALGLLSFETYRQRVRAEHQRVRAERQRAAAQLEGAQAAYARGDFLEARAQLRASMETVDSLPGRGVWQQLRQESLCWTRPLGRPVEVLSFSPDGATLASVTSHVVQLFDLPTGAGQTLHYWSDSSENHQAQAVFTPDGRYLMAIGLADCSAMAWDVTDGSVRNKLEPALSVCGLSLRGVVAGAVSSDPVIRLYDGLTGEQIASESTDDPSRQSVE